VRLAHNSYDKQHAPGSLAFLAQLSQFPECTPQPNKQVGFLLPEIHALGHKGWNYLAVLRIGPHQCNPVSHQRYSHELPKLQQELCVDSTLERIKLVLPLRRRSSLAILTALRFADLTPRYPPTMARAATTLDAPVNSLPVRCTSQ
jgi:hypothetical protein